MQRTKGSILIAGASRGVGEQIARHLSACGHKVILAARSAERLNAIANDLSCAAIAPVDFAKLETLPDWFENIVRTHGPLSGLVYCAGILVARPLKLLEIPAMEETFRVNVMAPMLLAREFRRPNAFTPPASIVLISSVMGLVGQPVQSLYSASKAAMLGFVRSAALELARQKIRVNAVAPGLVETDPVRKLFSTLTEEQRAAIVGAHALGLGQPMDVAKAVEFLVGENSTWITGTTLVVDGGYTAQ